MPEPLVLGEIDYLGNDPRFLVSREPHTLSEINSRTRRTLVPYEGPFYRNNFKLEFLDSDGNYSELVKDQDYYFSLDYIAGWVATSQQIHAGITVTTELLNGMVFVTYQRLGLGWWNGLRNEMLERLASAVYNPRASSWDMIANLPQVFPPGPHAVHWKDTKGLDSLVGVMNRLVDAAAQPKPHGLFYPQMVVEVLTKYDAVYQQQLSLQEDIRQIKEHLGLA